MTQKLFAILGLLTMILTPSITQAQTVVASEDFDGGAVNLIEGFDDSLAMTDLATNPGFTAFGVFNINDFGYVPFNLADDSMFPVSGSVFEFDFEGVVGGMKTDNFFTCTGYSCFPDEDFTPCTGTWIFDVSSATDTMTLSIDMGQLANDDFDGVPFFASILMEYSIDGGPFQTAFDLLPVELVGSGFTYRPMDNGNQTGIDFFGDNPDENATAGTHRGLGAVNAGVTKTLVETGSAAPNTILDKTEAATGDMDTFSIELSGSGSTLELRAVCDFNFQAFMMDNIRITTKGGKVLIGDVNCDGVIDLLDVAPFVDAVSNTEYDIKADVNEDGTDDLLDVAPFVQLLTGG